MKGISAKKEGEHHPYLQIIENLEKLKKVRATSEDRKSGAEL